MTRVEDIRIFGCAKKPKLKALIKKAALFFTRNLLPKTKHVALYIKIVDGLLKKEGVHGEVWHDDDSNHSFMCINSADNIHDIISTIAHECKHVQQFKQKRLKCRTDYNIWEGKKIYDDSIPYTEYPWEIEAYAAEKALTLDFYLSDALGIITFNNEMKSLENKNMYAKEWIPEIVIKKIKAGRPFELINGKKIYIIPDEEIISTLAARKPIGKLKLLTPEGKSYKFSDLAKTNEFDTEGIQITTTIKEDTALLSLISDIDGAKSKQGTKTIPIKIKGKVYEIYTARTTKGVPKSDFELVDGDGNAVVWISHKDGTKASDFRQWGGISASKELAISNHPEVKKFVADLKSKYPKGAPFDITIGRPIKDKRLKMLSLYGNQYGGANGIQNVNLLVQGHVGLIKRGNFYEIIATHIKHNGESADGHGYEPHLSAVKKSDRSDAGVPYTRITISPIGSMRKVVSI